MSISVPQITLQEQQIRYQKTKTILNLGIDKMLTNPKTVLEILNKKKYFELSFKNFVKKMIARLSKLLVLYLGSSEFSKVYLARSGIDGKLCALNLYKKEVSSDIQKWALFSNISLCFRYSSLQITIWKFTILCCLKIGYFLSNYQFITPIPKSSSFIKISKIINQKFTSKNPNYRIGLFKEVQQIIDHPCFRSYPTFDSQSPFLIKLSQQNIQVSNSEIKNSNNNFTDDINLVLEQKIFFSKSYVNKTLTHKTQIDTIKFDINKNFQKVGGSLQNKKKKIR